MSAIPFQFETNLIGQKVIFQQSGKEEDGTIRMIYAYQKEGLNHIFVVIETLDCKLIDDISLTELLISKPRYSQPTAETPPRW